MESPQISYFEVSPTDDIITLQTIKEKVAAEMRERIENETGITRIRFTFRNLSEAHPRPVVNNRWEAQAHFSGAGMESPQIGYFEVSTLDNVATLQAIKNKVAAKMREKIENEIGKTEITFTFRNLSDPNAEFGMKTRWEARADF